MGPLTSYFDAQPLKGNHSKQIISVALNCTFKWVVRPTRVGPTTPGLKGAFSSKEVPKYNLASSIFPNRYCGIFFSLEVYIFHHEAKLELFSKQHQFNIQRAFSQKHCEFSICILAHISQVFVYIFSFSSGFLMGQLSSSPLQLKNMYIDLRVQHVYLWKLSLNFCLPFTLFVCSIRGSITLPWTFNFLMFATIATGTSSCLDMVL